jgi:predicted nucleic acid-binding protein
MAAPGIKKLAVDSNLLFDLAAGKDFAHTFREAFQERGYSFRAPPTVVAELVFISLKPTARNSFEAAPGSLARIALQSMLSWQIAPFDLPPVGHGITEQFARMLQQRGYLPEGEFNDGLILAETSLAGIPVLVTNDHHLTDIDPVQLRLSFESSDLTPVIVSRPGAMLRALAKS